MKIYFAGSIRGGQADRDIYYEIIQKLQTYGEVLTEHMGMFEDGAEEELNNEQVYQRDIGWIASADVIVAEVTQPSLGVGYAIGKAEAMHKPVLCLYRMIPERAVSLILLGNLNITMHPYVNIIDTDEIFADFFASLSS